ncbi:MAG: D-2-hydroxyacid dehydrogenase [Pseudobutyrivibrio sp.]|nr:D-2-hydroxyacid dehydrogenase [Pseudobutyrivibrio sp.]
MKIVFLDRKTIGEDIDLSGFEKFGEVVIYDYSTSEEVPSRVEDADVIVLNKVLVNEQTIGAAKNLKLVCVTATGTNNLDKDYLAGRGIEWRNVAGYSTEAVAQHTFSLAFYLLEHLSYYDEYVKSEKYVNDKMFTHFEKHFHEISGKTWGIIGLGAIGSRVAEIAKLFGANVIYYSTSGRNHSDIYKEVDFDTLLSTSDVISIHAPLDDNTLHLIDKVALSKMKKSSILINVGRGPIIVEKDLAEALECGQIAAAGLDVLDVEPMSPENPLVRIKDSTKLLITPHIAWAAVEARQRLMKIIEGQIEEWSISLK